MSIDRKNTQPAIVETEGLYCIVIDDDLTSAKLIEGILNVVVFSFDRSSKFIEKREQLKSPIGIFLDVHLAEGECGLDELNKIAQYWPKTPVIVITGDTDDEIIGQALGGGAHDFISKPLRAGEVRARLNFSRKKIEETIDNRIFEFADIHLDLKYGRLKGPKGESYLSHTDAELLAHFISACGTLVSKTEIKRYIWGEIKISDNALDRKIFEIRKAVREVSGKAEIKSHYGKGITLQRKSHNDDQLILADKAIQLVSR
jgi:DNA-binding response OmpR family regulator